MPKIITFGEYVLFFWVSENDEPVHIHVAVKRPAKNSTKLWLTADGGCLVANNNSGIPEKDLRDLVKLVKFNHRYICEQWAEQFGPDGFRFYR